MIRPHTAGDLETLLSSALDLCCRDAGTPMFRHGIVGQSRALRDIFRCLDRVADAEDMSALAQDLGFSSHSHFAAAFKQAYGRSPSAFRQSARAKSA